jgi:hypothetical protein
MTHDRKAEFCPCTPPAILNTAFALELVQMKSDRFPILAELVRNARDVWGEHPCYAAHDFDVKALVLKRSPKLGD